MWYFNIWSHIFVEILSLSTILLSTFSTNLAFDSYLSLILVSKGTISDDVYGDDGNYCFSEPVYKLYVLCNTPVFSYICSPIWAGIFAVWIVLRVNYSWSFRFNDLRFYIAKEKIKENLIHRRMVIVLFLAVFIQFIVFVVVSFTVKDIEIGTRYSMLTSAFSFLFTASLCLFGFSASKYKHYENFTIEKDLPDPVDFNINVFPWYTQATIVLFDTPKIVDMLTTCSNDEQTLKKFGSVSQILETIQFLKPTPSVSRDSALSVKRHNNLGNCDDLVVTPISCED